MSNIHDTLDSILRKYYHKNTPANEKDVCLTVFKRKCASNNINADDYMKNFEAKNARQNQQQTRKTNYDGKHSSGSYYDFGDFEDIFGRAWEDIFRKAHQQKDYGPQPGSYYYEHKKEYVKEHGEFKDCIYTVNKDNIVIQALRKVGERWAIENFVFYCGGNPNDVIKQLRKYDMFKFVSNGTRYAGKLSINRIWGVDLNMREHPIY